MKKYLATVKDQNGQKYTLSVEGTSRDDALSKIPLRYHLIDLKEVPNV